MSAQQASVESEGSSLERLTAGVQFFGIASAILLFLTLVVPNRLIQSLSLLGLVATGSQFVFHGSTAVSMILRGSARRLFQIGISLTVPYLLSLYFLNDAAPLTVEQLFENVFGIWQCISLGVIWYVSWAFADQINIEHPFRGCLIAAAILFVVCFMGYNGIYTDYSGPDDITSVYQSKEAAEEATKTGRYWGQFLSYVGAAYLGILVKLMKKLRGRAIK